MRTTKAGVPAGSGGVRIAGQGLTWLLLAVAVGPIGGCAAVAGAGSVALTGKTPVDHVYSLATGKNCSMVRKERGLTYCLEDEVALPAAAHCYPTLGDATCYARAAPFPGSQRRLGEAIPLVPAAQRGPFDFVSDLVRPLPSPASPPPAVAATGGAAGVEPAPSAAGTVQP